MAERASSRDFKDLEESSDADNQTIKFLQGQSAQSSNEEEEDHLWNFMQDLIHFDSDGHKVLEDFVPSDQFDEEDKENEK